MIDRIKDGLCYDDVLLQPQYSSVKSRSEIDISVKWGMLQFSHPVIPANMKTVTGVDMAAAIMDTGGLAILHRFMPIEDQVKAAHSLIKIENNAMHLMMSVGVKEDDKDNIGLLYRAGVRMICIDIAHGDSVQCIDMIKWIRQQYSYIFIVAGNVATGQAAARLWKAGANVVKVGVGPGSLCTTRIETGNGVPQLSALIDVAKVRDDLILEYKNEESNVSRVFPFIADGGIKNAGDIVKALCFADMVMVGNLFSGCDETPGEILSIDGNKYKQYVGSSTHKTNHVEGVAAIVPTKGKMSEVLTKLLEGLRSGCSYQGSKNLTELKDNPVFMRITSAGLRESHPHDVKVI